MIAYVPKRKVKLALGGDPPTKLTNKGWQESGLAKFVSGLPTGTGAGITGGGATVEPIGQAANQFSGTAVGPSGMTWNPDPGGFRTPPGIPPGKLGIGARSTPDTAGAVAGLNADMKPPGKFGQFLASDKFKTDMNDSAAFASNLINSFRRPPMPKRGINDTYTSLQRVNLQNERNQVGNTFAAANRATERNIDSNTAEAVKAFNRGQEMSQLSSINAKETATNVGIGNTEAAMHQATSAANTGKENKFRDEMVERDIARQRESSANVANAGDKYVMLQNEKLKAKTEIAKANVLADQYSQSGVLERARRRLKEKGEPDPMGKDYKDLGRHGGIMKGLPSKRLS